MPFTLTDNPQLCGLKVFLSTILMIDLFLSNNRTVIFSETKKFTSQQTFKGPYIYDIHRKGSWGEGLCGRRKYMTSKWFKITTNSIIRGIVFSLNIKPDTF